MSRWELQGRTLLIPDKTDSERDRVAAAWVERGGDVLRVGRFWDPPPVDRTRVHLYGNDTFCLVLSQVLNLELISPPDDLLPRLDRQWTRRKIEVMALKDALGGDFPRFLKPLVPKAFTASVYADADELKAECEGLDPETEVMSVEAVEFIAEARFFVQSQTIVDGAVYEGSGDLSHARDLMLRFLATCELPEACVVDVAQLSTGEWAILEFNAAWGAGLNGCDPSKVVDVIASASRPGESG